MDDAFALGADSPPHASSSFYFNFLQKVPWMTHSCATTPLQETLVQVFFFWLRAVWYGFGLVWSSLGWVVLGWIKFASRKKSERTGSVFEVPLPSIFLASLALVF